MVIPPSGLKYNDLCEMRDLITRCSVPEVMNIAWYLDPMDLRIQESVNMITAHIEIYQRIHLVKRIWAHLEAEKKDRFEWYLFPVNGVGGIDQVDPMICSICHVGFGEGEENRGYPCHLSCTSRHQFHTECIKSWFERELICPCCKSIPTTLCVNTPHVETNDEQCVQTATIPIIFKFVVGWAINRIVNKWWRKNVIAVEN